MFGVTIRKNFEPFAMIALIGAFHRKICFHEGKFSNSGRTFFPGTVGFQRLVPLVKTRPIRAKPGVCRTELLVVDKNKTSEKSQRAKGLQKVKK